MQTELEHSYRPFAAAIATVAVVSQAETLPSGLLRYGAPAGQHDDTVMALAMAWHGVVGPRAGPNIRVFTRDDSAEQPYENLPATFERLRSMGMGWRG
jgi:hypothetical protein